MSEESKKATENEEVKVETGETAPEVETPEEKAPKTNDAPAEDSPAEDTPAEDTPAEDAPAEETPAEEAPAEEAPAETTAKAKPRTTMRFVLLIILLAVAWFAWKKHQSDAKFNKLIEMADSGNLAGAVSGLRELMNNSSGALKKRSKQELVRVILEQGDAPSNNVQESVVYYLQAYTVDPKVLEVHHLRALANHLSKDPEKAALVAEISKAAKDKMVADLAAQKALSADDGTSPEDAKDKAVSKAGAAVKAEVKKLPAKPTVPKQ